MARENTSNEENVNRILDLLESNGVGVVYLTATAYVVAYIFEISYLNGYGVSYKFATVDIPALIISIFFTLIFSVYATLIYLWISTKGKFMYAKNVKNPIVSYLAKCLALYALALLAYYLITPYREEYYQAKLTIVAVVAPPLAKAVDLLFKKASDLPKGYTSSRKVSFTKNNIQLILNGMPSVYLGLLLLLVVSAAFAGRMYQTSINDYPVVGREGSTIRVLISSSGQKEIYKDYSLKTKQFQNGYYVRTDGGTVHVFSQRSELTK